MPVLRSLRPPSGAARLRVVYEDEAIRRAVGAPERGLQSRSIFLAKSGGVTIFRREDR
jgi:hypothetical protein